MTTEKTETPEPRTCANCACHYIKETALGGEMQSYCSLDPPMSGQMRGERPVVRMVDGKPVPQMDRTTKKPLTENYMMAVYAHKPTQPELFCHSGWRPIGTLPGERIIAGMSERQATKAIEVAFDSLKEMFSELFPKIGVDPDKVN